MSKSPLINKSTTFAKNIIKLYEYLKNTKKEMECDHITPWHAGGKTNAENCHMLAKIAIDEKEQ